MLEYGPTHTADDDVELETALQELVLNLLRDGVETDIRCRTDFLNVCGSHNCRKNKKKSVWAVVGKRRTMGVTEENEARNERRDTRGKK